MSRRPTNTRFFGPTRVRTPNGTSTGSAYSVGLNGCDKQTDTQTTEHRQQQAASYHSAYRCGPKCNFCADTAILSVCPSHGWRRGVVINGVRCTNEVNARRARLVLGWVTVFGRIYHLVYNNKPTRSTQPCISPGSLN